MTESEPGLPPAPGNADTAANVEGMAPAPPDRGFGQLWLKTLRMPLDHGPDPETLVREWRAALPRLWPESGELYRSWRGLEPGEVAGIDLKVGPMTMSTGVVVDDVSARSFTLQSPEGHLFAGQITFSAGDDSRDGRRLTEARIEIRMRANDPLYELALGCGGHRREERFWAEMLWNLAALYGERPSIYLSRVCLDRRRQWGRSANIRHNAALRTLVRKAGRAAGAPLQRGRGA